MFLTFPSKKGDSYILLNIYVSIFSMKKYKIILSALREWIIFISTACRLFFVVSFFLFYFNKWFYSLFWAQHYKDEKISKTEKK